jgi:hypothetical protein
MASCFQPELVNLIGEQNYSNLYVFYLLSAAQSNYEKLGFCYLHSIILSVLLIFVANPVIASKLSHKCTRVLETRYKVAGSYADLLINVVLNICDSDPFWPSFGCIFQMIAPHVGDVLLSTALRVIGVFEMVLSKQKLLVPLFLEGFAGVVQRDENAANAILVALVRKHLLFKKLDAEDPRMARPLGIIRSFLRVATRAIKATKKAQLCAAEMAEVLADVHLEVDEVIEFPKHPHVYRGDMEQTWGEWATLLFVKAFRDEISKMQALQTEYDATLFAKL